jgi:hypothetical protein
VDLTQKGVKTIVGSFVNVEVDFPAALKGVIVQVYFGAFLQVNEIRLTAEKNKQSLVIHL